MERILLSTTTIGLALLSQAQLSPLADAPLYQHLLEVNKEWRTMDPTPDGGERIVHFANEADRIATHLHMVRNELSTRPQQGTVKSTRIQRTELLRKLGSYADRGLFPQNNVLPKRNPIFIDQVGTACAVGQLIIESGDRQLAERIAREMNFAYVHDMHRDDVNEWASTHGFTENELAWIQPGYPPNVPWAAMGGGTNGEVKELLRLSNGDMLVAGAFTQAGNTNANFVARYNGTTYTAMPGFPEGEIRTAIEFNGVIHVGGTFSNGVTDLAKWNGSSWTVEAVFSSKYAEIYDLHIKDEVLYAAGASSGFAGVSYQVQRLSNGTWDYVGQSLNGIIRTLETFDGQLVCGGDFTANMFSQDSTILHTATLNNGIWQQLGDGLNGRVYDMLIYQSQLYAGGDCVAEVNVFFGMARIAIESLQWEQLMPNIAYYIFSPLDGLTHINSLLEREGLIYFGGDFDIASGLDVGRCVGVFNGTADNVTVMADLNGPVNDLDLLGSSQLTAGGAFTENTGQATPYVITTDLATGMDVQETNRSEISIWPNPATDHITITSAVEQNTPITVRDAAGRTVMTMSLRSAGNSIDVRELSKGAYSVSINDGNIVRNTTFIKN
ncbi:MAG: T9SS type A sorting domain-containing protein [Flavobacteriales bacterium]|nr:T9SS type A sorting domain-containing protein [Flavobacteriales bacterium]